MNRNAFTGGPAYLTWNGLTIQMADDWKAETEIITTPQKTNLQGKIGEREEYSITRITFKPLAFAGDLQALFDALIPYTPDDIGTRIFPDSDVPAVIQTKSGRSITYSASAITKMPTVTFAPNKDLFGEVELTCLRKNNTAATDAAAHVADASSAYTEPDLDPLDIVSSTYALALGNSSPLNAIETDENGIVFEPTMATKERATNNDGLLNYQITEVAASVKFTPVNIDSSTFNDTLLKADGSTAGRGKFLAARGLELTVTGAAAGDPLLTIPNAVCPKGGLQFNGDGRLSEVTLQAQRTSSAGALQDLFTLSTVA